MYRLAPGVSALRGYNRTWLGRDALAGITVAAYLIPQVMAYAELAGLPAAAGLWASMCPLAVYAFLGSSRKLSVGPESTTALMTATAIGAVAARGSAQYADLAAALAIVVGVGCLIGWLGRLGFIADLLSRPVLVGYMAGIAVLMIVSQLGKITGISIPEGDPIEEVGYVLHHLGDVEPETFALGIGALAVLLIGRSYRPLIPWPLIAILVSTALVAMFDLQSAGISVVGEVPSELPGFAIPDVSWQDTVELLLPAVGVAIVAYSDNVLTARAFEPRGSREIDNNQEFLALGVSNVLTGLFHGFPVSSSGSRTAIGDSLRSHSQVYSLVALATVVLATVLLSPVLAAIPLAALGAVVIYAAIRLVDVAEMRRISGFRISEIAISLATTASVLVLGVLYGVLVAVGLSVIALMYQVARPHDAVLGVVPGVPGMHDVDDYPDAALIGGLMIYRYDSPLFFANASDFVRRALAAVDDSDPPVQWFVLNAEANVEIDLTGADALEDLRATIVERGIVFALARVKQDLRDDLDAAGLLERIGPEHIFMTLPTAVAAYVDWYRERHGSPPPGAPLP